MRLTKLSTLALLLCIFAGASVRAQTPLGRQQYEEDFDYLWQSISDGYAYFDRKQTDWKRVREIYRPRISGVSTRRDFVVLIETILEELYDFHTHLNTNTPSSPRLVPSGADMWAEWMGERAFITEVKPESSASMSGVRPGMQVVAINGVAVNEAVKNRLGKSLRAIDVEAKNWALRALLAGRRNEKRIVEFISDGKRRTLSIDDRPVAIGLYPYTVLGFRQIGPNIGYIRINNSLGNTDLIGQFDDALTQLRNTAGLILDLRDTPSGGNTTVARGIMGRFIRRDLPYQKHSIPSEERRFDTRRSWIELVSPRGDFTYTAPVVILANHWTGSMGEGITIGMDGMKRATVVGTEMARLVGATSTITLPNTGIGVTFPTEKLFHVGGAPRESFVPPVRVNLLINAAQGDEDIIFERGLSVLKSMIRGARRR